MKTQNEFMLVFRFNPNADYQPTAFEMEASHQQWGEFIGQIAMQEKFVSTSQLGFEGLQIAADKTVTEGIHIANSLTLGGNMIVKANSLAEAAEMAKGCPILNMGGSVEVRGITPM
jgi:hypothetical protein